MARRRQKVYEVYAEGDSSHIPSYFTNKREASSMAFTGEGAGNFDMATHHDVCELLEEKEKKIHELESALGRAAWLLAEQLPTTQGKPDPTKYDPEQRDSHNWIVRHAPDVADTHYLKLIDDGRLDGA